MIEYEKIGTAEDILPKITCTIECSTECSDENVIVVERTRGDDNVRCKIPLCTAESLVMRIVDRVLEDK